MIQGSLPGMELLQTNSAMGRGDIHPHGVPYLVSLKHVEVKLLHGSENPFANMAINITA